MAPKAKDTGSKPAPPKRPLTAFFIFKADQFEKTKGEHPEAKVTELTKIISDKWKNVDEAEKEKYNKKNAEAKAQYEKDLKAYEDKHGKIEKKSRKSKGKKEKGTKKASKSKPAAKSKKAKDEEEDDEEDDEEEDDEEEDEEEEDDEEDTKKGKKNKK